MSTIEVPEGDLARVNAIEPDRSWPLLVQIVVAWKLESGLIVQRTRTILADEFYGRGSFGAPMPGEALAQAVENMRREGPPEQPKPKKVKPTASRTPAKAKLRKVRR